MAMNRSDSRVSFDSVSSVESGNSSVAMDTTYTIDHLSSQTQTTEKKWRHVAPFFNINNNQAKCTNCSQTLKVQQGTNANLKMHYSRAHPTMLNDLKAAFEGFSKRGRHRSVQYSAKVAGKRQTTIEESMKGRFEQNKALDLYYRMYISNMMAASHTDNAETREFFGYVCPEFQVPSHRKLTKDIKAMGDQAKTDLTDLLAKQEFLATTADSWSAGHRAFLGMTVTYVDAETLERMSAVLGVKELYVSQIGKQLSEKMNELQDDFGIGRKIVSTTTDNGANYVAAMVMCAGNTPQPDTEVEEPTLNLVTEFLEEAEQQNMENIPVYRRCAAHTVNLLASKDTEHVPGWTAAPRPAFSKPAAKAQSLWNAQNRNTVTANEIKAALGKKFVTPGATRWNSSYDAYKCLVNMVLDVDRRNKLNQICQRQQPNPLPTITEEDVKVWSEYVKVTAPLAICLDVLQGEETTYMGDLLPHLQLLKDSLKEMSTDESIVHAKNLVAYLLHQNTSGREGKKGFDGRFGHLFLDEALMMATALHPHHKLVTVRAICRLHDNDAVYSRVKERLIRSILQLIQPEPEQVAAPLGEQQPGKKKKGLTDYLHDVGRQDTQHQLVSIEEKVREQVERWSSTPLKNNPKLARSLFPQEFRDVWVRLFLQYNTALPSSASVERVFSYGSDILRAKRSAWLHRNSMKGNMKMLKEAHELEYDEKKRGADEA